MTQEQSTPSSGPLTGLRVIDCSSGPSGIRVAAGLVDYGADVVWLEPTGGDALREEFPVEYAVYNRGKRGVELDVQRPDHEDRLHQLLRAADVLVVSLAGPTSEAATLQWDALHERHPHLIVAKVSGFGPGPDAHLPAYDSLVAAFVGVSAEQVGVREAPIYEGLPFASVGAAYLAQLGILAALHRRRLDGHGRLVETSLVDGALAYLGMVWGDSDDPNVMPRLNPGARRLVSRTFLCGDGEYLGVHTGAVGAFDRFIEVVGLVAEVPPVPADSTMGVVLTDEQTLLMRDRIPEILATRPRRAWLDVLIAADVCAIPVLRAGEAFDEPQARHNGMVLEVDDPVLGRLEQVSPPAKLRDDPTAANVAFQPAAAPSPGQHSAEVLAEYAALPARLAPTAEPDRRPLLDGLRVADFGAYYAGPYSSRLLADLGADVLKVETIAGDQLRGLARCFRSAQAGKRAISVDLKDPGLAPALESILSSVDVIAHNMRPGAAERLGMGYEQVRGRNPAIIYLDSPPWGTSGPRMYMQSFAPLVSGIVGASYEVAGRFNEPLFPAGNEDPGSGLLGAVAVLVALYARDEAGRGRYIENSQFNATFAHVAHIVRRDGEVLNAGRLDPLQFGVAATDRIYQAADGWLSFAVAGPHTVPALRGLLGRDVSGESRYSTPAARAEHDEELTAELMAVFAAHDLAWARQQLDGLNAAVVRAVDTNNCATYHRDPENQRTGRIASVTDPNLGVIREIDKLVRVSDAEVMPHRLAPELGEHTDEVLTGLGYSAADLDKLRARHAIR